MNIFETYAKIGLDTKDLMSGLAKARAKVSAFSNGVVKGAKVAATGFAAVTAGATAVSGALTKGIKDVTEYGDSVDKMSQRIGLSAEAYQKWDYVMNIAGTEMKNMRIGLKTLTNQISKAQKGTKESQENFKKLGISMNDLNKMSREEAFGAVIKGFQGMADSTERAALANKMFGRSGQELTPLFNQSAKSTDELLKKAEDYGMIMSDKAVKASATFKDSLTTLQMTMTGLKNKMMGVFLPSATKVTDGLAKMFTGDYKKGSKEFEKGIEGIIKNAKVVLPKVAKIGKTILGTIGKAIADNIDDIAIFGTNIIIGTISGIIKALPTLISAIPTIIGQISNALQTNLPLIIESAKQLISMVFNGITSNGGEFLTKALSFLSFILDQIGTQAPILIPKAVAIISDLIFKAIDFITTNAPSIISSLLTAITGILNGIVNALPSLISKITTQIPILISNIASLIAQTLPQLVDNVISIFENLVNNLPSMIENFLNNLPSMLDGIGAAIEKLLPVVMDGATKLVNALIKSAPKLTILMLKLPPMIMMALVKSLIKLAPRLYEIGKTFIKKTIDGAKSMFESIKKYISDLWGKIVKFFHIDDMIEIGKDIVKGLWKGIQSMVKWLTDKVSGFADGIVGKMKKTLGIHSPSRVFAAIGRFMAEGLGIGWSKAYDKVQKIINDGMTFDASVTNKVENGPSTFDNLRKYIADMNNDNYERLIEALESTTIVLDNKEVGRAVRRYA